MASHDVASDVCQALSLGEVPFQEWLPVALHRPPRRPRGYPRISQPASRRQVFRPVSGRRLLGEGRQVLVAGRRVLVVRRGSGEGHLVGKCRLTLCNPR